MILVQQLKLSLYHVELKKARQSLTLKVESVCLFEYFTNVFFFELEGEMQTLQSKIINTVDISRYFLP